LSAIEYRHWQFHAKARSRKVQGAFLLQSLRRRARARWLVECFTQAGADAEKQFVVAIAQLFYAIKIRRICCYRLD
jgi:hypothetical protein